METLTGLNKHYEELSLTAPFYRIIIMSILVICQELFEKDFDRFF